MRVKKYAAFTMSEILLVMGVIGAIAALTLPNLGRNVDEGTLVAQTKKVAADLQIGAEAVINRWGEPNEWTDVTSSLYASSFSEKLEKVMSVTKNCKTTAGCFGSKSSIDGDIFYSHLILKDGAFVAIKKFTGTSSSCATTTAYACKYGDIFVDVNGMSPPNTEGFDQFYFVFSKNGIEPMGYTSDYGVTIDTTTKSNNTAWVIKAGNEDYNKCTGLSWPDNTTCN